MDAKERELYKKQLDDLNILIESISEKIKIHREKYEKDNNDINEINIVDAFIEKNLEITGDNKDKMNITELYKLFKMDRKEKFLSRSQFKFKLQIHGLREKNYSGIRAFYGIKKIISHQDL